MEKKNKLDDNDLEAVNGGFIVSRGTFYSYYVVDGSGRMAAQSYYLSYAKKRAAQYGLSDMVITRDEYSQLLDNGYFIRDGVKYSESDGVVMTE